MDSEIPGVAVITGGHGGLASAIRECLSARGWDVRAPGRGELDVMDRVGVDYFFRECGPVDLLVNSAGFIDDALSARMEPGRFALLLDTHLGGAWRCARAASMRRGGQILQIVSHSAWDGKAGQAAYAAAKAGMIGLTQSLARELGPSGIRVNAIAPGFLETRMTAGVSEAARRAIAGQHCLARMSSPEDVARFIVALQEMPAISGQLFRLDSRIGKWTG